MLLWRRQDVGCRWDMGCGVVWGHREEEEGHVGSGLRYQGGTWGGVGAASFLPEGGLGVPMAQRQGPEP